MLFPLSEEARFYISSAFTRGWLILLFTVIRNYIINVRENNPVKDIAEHFQSLGVGTDCGLLSDGSLLAEKLLWEIIDCNK